MKIALIGASGRAGSCILKELSDRGHDVTAIARHSENIAALPGVTPLAGDATDLEALTDALNGHEAVVSSVKFQVSDPRTLIAAVKGANVGRYLVVGGAGSLLDEAGNKLIDTPMFPEAYKPEAAAGGRFLELLRAEPDLDWTFLSPAFVFSDGERTGTFRLGGDVALKGEQGPSRISFADYAIAVADEIEMPKHRCRRFSIAY